MCKENINHTHGKSTHTHSKLSNIRSNVYVEMFGEKEKNYDDENVKRIKDEIAIKGESIELFLELTKALCLQFRYRGAIKVCDQILRIDSNNYQAKRIKAIRLLTTARLDESLRLFEQLNKESNDKLDIEYRIALCFFYKKEYKKAKDIFYSLFSLCQDNSEMYIAVLYWYLLSLMCLNENIDKALNLYFEMDVGHHVGYDYAIKLFKGEDAKYLEEKSKVDNLTNLIFLVGQYFFYEYKKENKLAITALDKAYSCDEYWSSFSGLAIWYFKVK